MIIEAKTDRERKIDIYKAYSCIIGTFVETKNNAQSEKFKRSIEETNSEKFEKDVKLLILTFSDKSGVYKLWQKKIYLSTF